jgi:hypothetical protein
MLTLFGFEPLARPPFKPPGHEVSINKLAQRPSTFNNLAIIYMLFRQNFKNKGIKIN